MNTANGMTPDEMQFRQQQIAEAEEKRISILDQILESGAKDRLARLALVKKEKARSVEDSLIQAAQNGRLPGKVSEAQLIVMLEQLSGHEEEGLGNIPRKSKVVIQRRKYSFDDDNDNDDSDLL